MRFLVRSIRQGLAAAAPTLSRDAATLKPAEKGIHPETGISSEGAKFADDTKLIREVKTRRDGEELQEIFPDEGKRAAKWQMRFNVRSSHSEESKDFSLPNASWSPAMMRQFHKFTELSKDKTWERVPTYRLFVEHIPGATREEIEASREKGTRFFPRSLDVEGAGFEYVMFLNPREKRLVCLFQPGPYLEGSPGFVNGGAIATILDSALGRCAMLVASRVLMASLSVNFRSPVALGSVVLADCKLDRHEGRKVFVLGQVQSTDGQILHAEATGVFVQLPLKKSSL